MKSWPPLKLCGEGRQQTAVHQSDLGARTWWWAWWAGQWWEESARMSTQRRLEGDTEPRPGSPPSGHHDENSRLSGS